MIVNKREPGFSYTVGAAEELGSILEENEVKTVQELITGSRQREGMTAVILILSKWHERKRAAEDPEYEQNPITRSELELLSVADFYDLFAEAVEAMNRDMRRTVETENAQKKTGDSAASS